MSVVTSEPAGRKINQAMTAQSINTWLTSKWKSMCHFMADYARIMFLDKWRNVPTELSSHRM